MRRAFVGIFLLVLSGCGKTDDSACSDVLCPNGGRGECVDIATDPAHCGGCEKECDEGESCRDGRCSGCADGETLCGTICADLRSSPANCGACWADCAGNEECVSGECTAVILCGGEECENGEECVDDECVAPGLCGGGECASGEECVDDECVASGLCGGSECASGEVCVDDVCAPTSPCVDGTCDCEVGETQCGQRCFDLQSDARHCGSCTNVCASGLACVEGSCECPSEMLDCWSGCLDASSDPLNCGACGALCENSTSCQDGACRCPEGLTSCDGTCVDPDASRFHCGGCGVECEGAESCVAGSCQAPPATETCTEAPVNVEIRRVAIYQGVEVDLVSTGAPVPPAERDVDVARGRDALVRVFVDPAANFEPTTLVGSLTLEGAQLETYVSPPVEVMQASNASSLDSTLNIYVPGAAITEGLQYSVQISACQVQAGGSVGTVRIPAAGTAALGARRTGEVAVRFIPVVHDGRVPDTSPEILDIYAREVMRQYPVTALSWDLGTSIVSNQTGILLDLALTLDQVTELREQENPPSNVYYYGLVDPAEGLAQYCDGGCTTGIAWWLPTINDWEKAHRAGVGIAFGTYGANTFAHELGHNLGRDHSPCGTEGDPNYPHPGASIGVWGYDPVGGVLKDPNLFTDLMGYCEPNWVSDYTYNAVFQRVAATQPPLGRRVSQTESSAGTQAQRWASYVVTERRVKWSRSHTRLGAPTNSPEKGVVYDSDGVAIAEVEVHRILMADSSGYKVFVPQKQPGWFAVGLADGVALPYE